jgi:vitamin B12 transporter
MRFTFRLIPPLAVALGVTAAAASAQTGAPVTDAPAVRAAEAALQACMRAAGGDPRTARAAADEAERRFRELRRSGPGVPEAQVGLAQVLIRCQLPHASVAGIMTLVGEAETELRSVLDAQPDHWDARFTLAMLLKNMPPMLGRGADAVREFERLLAQQGRRADGAHLALPWLHLGELHEAAGRRGAAVDTWRRGLALFPAHELLVARLRAAGAEAVPDTTWLAQHSGAAVAKPVDGAGSTMFAFSPLRVEALNHQFQEARAGSTLRRLDVYTMPGGTGDMLQALQAMPGATRAGDGGELYIRGGDPAETPVFFDGGRLAFPGRWESLRGSAMGVVDASVLRRAYFSSGGFSARYGNALSGVVDVESEGRPSADAFRIGANMVQAGATVRGSAGERTGAWGTLSATDTRLIARMNGDAALYTRAPQSVQGIGGVSFEPLPGVELRGSVLSLGDRYGRLIEMNAHAGEFASSSTMQHAAFSARALRPDGRRGISGSITASRRAGEMRFGVLDRAREDRAVGGRLDSDAVLARSSRVRSGVELLHYRATASGRVPATASLAADAPSRGVPEPRQSAWHAGGYVEAEHAPLPGFAMVAGVRVDALPGEDAASADPRLAAAYTGGAWTLRAGAGIFHQGRWRSRYLLPDPGRPSGVPRRAQHLVAGAERAGTLSLRVEAYAKRYDDYVADGAGPAVAAGTSTGIDAIARWSPRAGPTGWLSWSLLRGRLSLADGAVVPSALDVTHSLTAVARLPLGAWELGATGRYATGRPFTPVTGIADGAPQYGPLHGERLPDYRRLDARITRYVFGDRRMALAYLEVLNLLDEAGVTGYTHDARGGRVPIDNVFSQRTFVLGFELQF